MQMGKCKYCGKRIRKDDNQWYHIDTEAARCKDDASFVYAEPK